MRTHTRFTIMMPVKVEIGKDLHYRSHIPPIVRMFRDEMHMEFKSGSHDLRANFKLMPSAMTAPTLINGITGYTFKQEQTKTHVFVSAIAWWESKRPVGWTEPQHLALPAVNCQSGSETELAEDVARAINVYRHTPSKLPE